MSQTDDCVSKDFLGRDERKTNTCARTGTTGPPTALLIKKSSDGREPRVITAKKAIKLGLRCIIELKSNSKMTHLKHTDNKITEKSHN